MREHTSLPWRSYTFLLSSSLRTSYACWISWNCGGNRAKREGVSARCLLGFGRMLHMHKGDHPHLRRVATTVGVVLHGEFAVSLLEVSRVRVFLDTLASGEGRRVA